MPRRGKIVDILDEFLDETNLDAKVYHKVPEDVDIELPKKFDPEKVLLVERTILLSS